MAQERHKKTSSGVIILLAVVFGVMVPSAARLCPAVLVALVLVALLVAGQELAQLGVCLLMAAGAAVLAFVMTGLLVVLTARRAVRDT